MIVEVGKSDISRIYRLCNSYDKLQSKWSQSEINQCKRAEAKMQRRIRNLVDELHKKKVTKWTCKNFNTIFLPKGSWGDGQVLKLLTATFLLMVRLIRAAC
jgi:hypothetical protein